MPIIYHISTKAEWEKAMENGFYDHPSLHAEGFIHCSQDHQVAGVMSRYFKGKTDLVKLTIDTDKLTSKFVFDWSPSSADTFPHIYGRLNMEAVVGVEVVLSH